MLIKFGGDIITVQVTHHKRKFCKNANFCVAGTSALTGSVLLNLQMVGNSLKSVRTSSKCRKKSISDLYLFARSISEVFNREIVDLYGPTKDVLEVHKSFHEGAHHRHPLAKGDFIMLTFKKSLFS